MLETRYPTYDFSWMLVKKMGTNPLEFFNLAGIRSFSVSINKCSTAK
jgi:hypothetical protein